MIDSFANSANLKYAMALSLEVMRVRSPAPHIIVEALEDVTVNGMFVKKGQGVAALTRYVGNLEENFSNPKEFNPDRWLDEASARADWIHTPNSVLSFGSGPRVCPGRSLAFYEMQLVLTMLAKDFEFELEDPNTEIEEDFRFTLKPKEMKVRVKPRS